METAAAYDLKGMFNDGPDESMTELAGRLWEIKQREKKAKEDYEGLKTERMEMEEALNIMMENVGVDNFRTQDATFFIRHDFYANVKKEDERMFHQWLRDHEFGNLIRETVNPRTLSAFAREQQITGGDLPDCINITTKRTIGTRKR